MWGRCACWACMTRRAAIREGGPCRWCTSRGCRLRSPSAAPTTRATRAGFPSTACRSSPSTTRRSWTTRSRELDTLERIAPLGNSDLDVFPLCLGGNVFGWTIDEERSFAVLDAYVEAGGNFIDTADSYGRNGPGGAGESERIIGRWIAARGNRDRLVIATEGGMSSERSGLSGGTIRQGIEDSLGRLGIDSVDLYYAHKDDPDTPLAQTLGAFGALIGEGKIRYAAASNYSASRLREALRIGEREGMASYVALQPHYNLVER